MRFFNLNKKEYKRYAKMFRKTYIGKKLFSIFVTFLAFTMINLSVDFTFDVILEKETSAFSTIILWSMCISLLISYYTYFKYLKEYIEKND